MAILTNGVNYSWGNVIAIILGVPIVGITKIDYKAKQTKENQYGQGFDPVSVGYGNVEYEGTLEMYLDEWKKIIAASPNRDPLQIPFFDITVVFGGSRVLPDKDVLNNVEFLENPMTTSQGETKILVQIPFRFAGIKR